MGILSRVVKPLALAAASVLALSACGGGSSASGASTAAAGSTVTYWSMWKEGEPQQKVIAQAIDDFQTQTGIKVKVQWQGRSNTEKLVPALNTNNVPDIVDGAYAKLAPVIGDTGQAAPLDDAWNADVEGTKVADLIPQKLSAVNNIKGKDGKPWMLPYSLSSDGVWFNAAAHPELVSSPPKTWSDFIGVLDKIKASGKTPLAADGDIAGYNAAWFVTLMVRSGGPGAFHNLVSDRSGAAWDDPKVLEAAQKVEQIVRGGYLVPGYDASKWPAQQQVWAAGKAELMYNGSWTPTETASYAAQGFQYSSFPFPSTTDGSAPAVRADYVGWAVPAKAKNIAGAKELAEFMLKKKYQDAYGTDAKVLPIRADAAVSPQMATVKKALEAAPSVYLQYDGVTYPGFMEKTFMPLDDQLFLGKISAKDFVAKAKDAQTAYWKDKG